MAAVSRHGFAFVCALVACAAATKAQAQQRPLGWTYSAQVSAVWTAGNSSSRTVGLASTLDRLGAKDEVKLEAAGVRSDATLKTRRAIGTDAAYRIDEIENHERTAESYFVRGRYDRTVGNGFLVFGGVDWMRNTFAGVDSRLLLAAGAGRLWADRKEFRFKTDLAGTYSFQQDVVENPFTKSSFPGVRASYELMRILTPTTKWESTLIGDMNLEDTRDLRGDWNNALALTVSTHFALKPGLELFWRNRPSLTELDLFDATGAPTGEKVRQPLEKLDSLFTLALVLTL